ANKDSYPAYLSQAVRLVRPGGLILADNVVREGDVLAPKGVDASAIGAAAFNQALAEHPQLEAIILQQVGAKGHDGLAIARVKNT
ncbi:MAG: O-methyltransferase, partial [Pseudomonadota bacterium]